MRRHRYSFPVLTVISALGALALHGTMPNTLYAETAGMGAPPSEVEITIHNRQDGYETEGMTMPSHDTIITVHNEDSVTHGLASTLFQGIDVRVENGLTVTGKNFKSFHVEAGEKMRLYFATAPTKFDPAGGAESVRYALWCDMHPEVKGELYVIETRGEIGGG